MAAAVWMIIYDLGQADAEAYLQWFDEVHIPEKLARPGYTWAAHYQVVAEPAAERLRYIALFGGTDSRVFYDPSPAQIKPLQPPQTRAMMSCRSNSTMLILAEEWAVDGNRGLAPGSAAISAPQINLALFDTGDNDEDLGAWLVQDYLAGPGKVGITRKFLASTGAVRHVLLQESQAREPTDSLEAASSDWSSRVLGSLIHPAGEPMLARRIWPAIT